MEFLFNLLKKLVPKPLFKLLQPPYHHMLAFLAAAFYLFPSRKMVVVGVTGTNGKTTVVELLHAIWQEAEFETGSVSSLRFKIGDEEKKNLLKMTMPGRFTLQKFLRKCVNAGCKYAVLEVTSEGIKQFRNKFVKFDIAVMTNITPEHIESHGNFENYLETKLKLFEQVSRRPRPDPSRSRSDLSDGILIVNGDDPNAQKFLQFPAKEKYVYNSGFIGIEKDGSTKKMSVSEKLLTPEGISFKIGDVAISSHLIGEFNLYNLLAAISVSLSQNIKLETIRSALAKISGVPGRLEFVQKKPFAVVVDYAHTPDALRKVYQTLTHNQPALAEATAHKQPTAYNPRLICVLGSAGGGRDKWKRPEMGKIAAEFCDKIILTDEDPYDENPNTIINEIEIGFSQFPLLRQGYGGQANYKKMLDRREAIHEAIKSAGPGDTVIITGKGAEPYIMGPNNTKISWDDRQVAKEKLVFTNKPKRYTY